MCVGRALSYGAEHPYGEFVTEETVNGVSFDDVQSYYNKYFGPNDAYLVVIGDVNTKEVYKRIKKYFGKWKKTAEINSNVPEANANVEALEINFIDMPNAVQSNISITSNVKLKMSDPSEEYWTMEATLIQPCRVQEDCPMGCKLLLYRKKPTYV